LIGSRHGLSGGDDEQHGRDRESVSDRHNASSGNSWRAGAIVLPIDLMHLSLISTEIKACSFARVPAGEHCCGPDWMTSWTASGRAGIIAAEPPAGGR
jgi:hypothetical protein